MPALGAGKAVWDLRTKFDPSAPAGIPPHVTLMFPFLPPEKLGEQACAELAALIDHEPAFDFRLTRVLEFEQGVVYLEPEPAEPFVRLTAEIALYFGLRPFGGEFGDAAVPHLTLATPQAYSVTQQIRE